MEELLLNTRIAAGLAKAALIVGHPYTLYRPLTATQPLKIMPSEILNCAFDAKPDFRLLSTMQPGCSYTFLLADSRKVQKNDYLVGTDTYFIARTESLRPALCILCDNTVDLLTIATSFGVGSAEYDGRTSTTNTVVASGWPVSMNARTRGEADVTKLPSDIRAAYYDVLTPEIPGIILTFGMQIRDIYGQSYEIISAELSPFGWKLLAGLITT